MERGLHLIDSDANSKLDPEVLSYAARITPNLSNAFGKVLELFGPRPSPLTTEEYRYYVRSYTQPEIVSGPSPAGTLWDHVATAAALPVTAATIDRVTVGHVLMYGDEIVVVKAVDRTANTIDVYERGAGESVGAAHGAAGGDTITIIGNAHEEAKVDPEGLYETTGYVTNYCQLFEKVIEFSKENQDQDRKIGRTEDELKFDATTQVAREMARNAIYGVSRAPAAGVPGMSRGLLQHLALAGGLGANVAGAFTSTVLKTGFETVRKAGGNVNAIVMSVAKKKIFNGFSDADIVHEDAGKQTTGRIVSAFLADGFGEVPVVVDLDFPDDKVALVNSTKLSRGWKVNDPLRFVDEPAANSRRKKQSLQGKLGYAVEGLGTDQYLLTGLT